MPQPVLIDIPAPEFHHPAELAMLARLRDHGPELIDQYLRKETRNGVVFIARDAAKRVFPEYKEDPTGNNRYSDRAASALADAVRRLILSHPPATPRNEIVIFTGAPASGKSAAGRPVDIGTVEFVHETIFPSFDKARSLVQESLDADRLPAVSLVYTRDPRINVRRMIDRARRIGRTVPVAFMARAWVGVPRIVAALSAQFPVRLRIWLADNSGVPDEVRPHQDLDRIVALAESYTIEGCLRVMDDELIEIDACEPVPTAILHEARLR